LTAATQLGGDKDRKVDESEDSVSEDFEPGNYKSEDYESEDYDYGAGMEPEVEDAEAGKKIREKTDNTDKSKDGAEPQHPLRTVLVTILPVFFAIAHSLLYSSA